GVDAVPALATGRLGERDAEQPGRGGFRVQRARQFAGGFPLVEVRRDLARRELARERAQREPFGGRPHVFGHDPPSSKCAGIVTCRARSHSPRPLACGSWRVPAATPSPSRPCTTKLSDRRFGKSYRLTRNGAVSGSNCWNFSTVSPADNQSNAS